MSPTAPYARDHTWPISPCTHTFGPLGSNGCWFCDTKEPTNLLVFSLEWDCVVHLCCIGKALYELHHPDPNALAHPPEDDIEALVFAKEFGITLL